MGQGCLFRVLQGLACVLVVFLIVYGQSWINPSMRIILAQAYGSSPVLFTLDSECIEPEAAWCTVLRHYALHPHLPPVEIVFHNPNTWFNAEPNLSWQPRLPKMTSYPLIPDCNLPCRFLVSSNDAKSHWFEFFVDTESWTQPVALPGKAGNIRLVMEAWSVDRGVPDTAFDIAATIHLDNTPPRLPFTYPDFPVSELAKPRVSFKEKTESKRALIGLFLRHCGDVVHRDEFIGQLISETQIDSFGGCYHSRSVSKECRGKPYFEEKVCELRNYKFVLGIENTLIADYVTEKLYHALWAGAIPVYWGPPNVADFLPENGAINIASFNGSVRALVTFIKEVGYNETLYNSFHAWRDKPLSPKLEYIFRYSRSEGTCNICKRAAVVLWNKGLLNATTTPSLQR